MDNIASKFHKALELDPERNILLAMGECPYYVFNEELMNLVGGKNSNVDSITAILDAGLGKLPYPQMAIELWGGSNNWRYFTFLSETDRPDRYVAGICEMITKSDGSLRVLEVDFNIEFIYQPAQSPGKVATWKLKCMDHKDWDRRDIIDHAVAALELAILMPHMHQLDREVIEPRKLNRVRAKSGKAIIRTHVLVRIGHVYDRSGNKVKVTDANRRTMPIHMRAAHTRMQPHGERWIEENKEQAALPTSTADHHLVFIPPVLVNYNDGSDLPLPKPRIVKF